MTDDFDDFDDFADSDRVVNRLHYTRDAVDASFAQAELHTDSTVHELEAVRHVDARRRTRPFAVLAAAACAATIAIGATSLAAHGSHHPTTTAPAAAGLGADNAAKTTSAAGSTGGHFLYTKETTSTDVDNRDHRFVVEAWFPASGVGGGMMKGATLDGQNKPVDVKAVSAISLHPEFDCAATNGQNDVESQCGWGDANTNPSDGQGGFYNPTAALVTSLPTEVSQLSAKLHAFAEASAAAEAKDTAGTSKAVVADAAEISSDELWTIEQLYRTGAVTPELGKAILQVLTDLANDPASQVKTIANAKNLNGEKATGFYVSGKAADVAILVNSAGVYIGEASADGDASMSTAFSYGTASEMGKAPNS